MLLFLAVIPACEDETTPPAEPEFVGRPLVQCRSIERVVKLSRVEFTVRDLDGPEDLREPFVIVEATRLAMTELPRTTPDDEDCAADDGKCDVTYAWEQSRDSEQIYCGDDGTALKVLIEVQDQDRHVVRGTQQSSLDE